MGQLKTPKNNKRSAVSAYSGDYWSHALGMQCRARTRLPCIGDGWSSQVGSRLDNVKEMPHWMLRVAGPGPNASVFEKDGDFEFDYNKKYLYTVGKKKEGENMLLIFYFCLVSVCFSVSLFFILRCHLCPYYFCIFQPMP